MHQNRKQPVTRSTSLTGYSPELVLLEHALRGDHDVFVKLLKPHERILFVFARRFVDCPICNDAYHRIQEGRARHSCVTS